MRKLLPLLTVLILLCAQASQASTLVFKATKTVKSGDYLEIGTIDVSKFKRIRILVNRDSNYDGKAIESARVYALDENKEMFLTGDLLQFSYTTVLEIPPPKIRVKADATGTFTLYVWAE